MLFEIKIVFSLEGQWQDLNTFLTIDRGTETEEQIQKRLRNALAELEQGKSSGLFDHILVNDNLEPCYANLKVLKA